MSTHKHWQKADLTGLLGKLTEAKQLLEQAAALAAAREGHNVRIMAELQRQKDGEQNIGKPRRYR